MSTRRRAGAVFHRCALQVNPHHYGETFRGQASDGDSESHAEAIVKKAAELDVSVMAITDHNSVSGVPVFRQFAEWFGITIFPGFELASSEGIHVLCIYPPDTGSGATWKISWQVRHSRYGTPPRTCRAINSMIYSKLYERSEESP